MLLGSLALAAVVTGAEAAIADCLGPTVSHDGGDLSHGDQLTVSGIGFGDSCFDTGPPPPGQGSLGMPLHGIEVYLAQEDQLHLVATGNADQDYGWEVPISIPPVLDVGEVEVIVMSGGSEAFQENSDTIWVLSERVEGASTTVVTFGPSEVADPEPGRPPVFTGTNWTPVILLVGAAGVVVTLIAVRHRQTSTSSVLRRRR
jgi:hypothetical protein